MKYWWVSQNKTYRHEKELGILWAPKQDRAGRVPFHWKNMSGLRLGDVVFSYVAQRIPSVSVVRSDTYTADRPAEFSDTLSWEKEGWMAEVTYEELDVPISVPPIAQALSVRLQAVRSPLNRLGTGNQGYLFAVQPAAARFLLELIPNNCLDDPRPEHRGVLYPSEAEVTEREAVVKARIGQGRFRKDLITYWGGACAVTGLSEGRLLKASHIRPWRDSNNFQRLDHYNGLLLGPQYDFAFDQGFISFADNGVILISPSIAEQLHRTGIAAAARLRKVEARHRLYLRFHRQFVFRSGSPESGGSGVG